MYDMDRYPAKKSQNTNMKVKIKQNRFGKKESWKKVEWNIYYCFILSVGQLIAQFYLYHGKLFS